MVRKEKRSSEQSLQPKFRERKVLRGEVSSSGKFIRTKRFVSGKICKKKKFVLVKVESGKVCSSGKVLSEKSLFG